MSTNPSKPQILLINDDGIHAPGIRHLWKALAGRADITIVAPAQEQSGVGVSLTLRTPLQMERVEWEEGVVAWKVNGTPADCVRMALGRILTKHPDMIISGINRGSNAGRNVLYSGTVGGVIEGTLRNIPGLALSCEDFFNPIYKEVEKYIFPIVSHLLQEPLPAGTLLNVTFPSASHLIKGIKLARQGMGYWIDNIEERLHPEGNSYYWQGGKWSEHTEKEDSDVAWLKQGYITAVPLSMSELTDHQALKNRKETYETLFS
jgi:5'-nucleotidase